MTEANRVSSRVIQQSHGFGRGSCVRFDGTNWVLAISGAPGVGVVGNRDADSFEFVQVGLLDGLDSLVPGAEYFPDESGELSTTGTGSSVGTAYDSRTLFVQPPISTVSAAPASSGVSMTQLVSAVASEASRADLALAGALAALPSLYIHSIQNLGVISISSSAPGPVFDISDGTQILTA